jgi:dolichol-phosphate mannosyltransferase
MTGNQNSITMLSLLLPSKGETKALWQTMEKLRLVLDAEKITHEFVVVNDVKTTGEGGTAGQMLQFQKEGYCIQYMERLPPAIGFGTAVVKGLESFSAPAVMILMADGSEEPADVVRFYRKFEEGYDCVFGDRFRSGGNLIGYSSTKLIWNRLANWLLSLLFVLPYRDFTNASKLYSRKAIEGMKPIFSEHFNITIELPLKAFVRGFKIAVVPNTWRAEEPKESQLRLSAMGKRYAYTALRIFWER